MSKSLNLLAPAIGGTALVLGIAYGVTTREYRAAEADLALSQAAAAAARAEAAEALAAETANAARAAADAQAAELQAAMQRAAEAEARAADAAAALERAAASGQPVAAMATVTPKAGGYGLGRPATEDEVLAWNVDVSPDGTGLPVGSGSVEDGEMLFSENCAVCHGEFAEGAGNWPKLAGGDDTLANDDPVKTVGSYWPYLSTAWDYVHRSMPFGNAQSLSADDTYAIVAYILYSNFLVDDDFVLSNENFLEVEMPNADGFIIDDRAETEYSQWRAEPCMENCKESVEITMRATVLDVTPDTGDDNAAAPAEPETTEVAMAEPAGEPAGEAGLDPALVAAGEEVFKKCKACHQVGDGAKNRTGPLLNGVVGAPVGHVADFRYSNVFKDANTAGQIWDEAALAAFLANPKGTMTGTKMSFNGLTSEADISAVIAYLKSFGG